MADWQIDGWQVGLCTAGYLRRYFPGFWVAHVAQKPTITARLLGVYHAFLVLGHHELIALDLAHPCPLDLSVPLAELPSWVDGWRDEGGIIYELSNDLAWWVFDPPAEVYGLNPISQRLRFDEGGDPLGATLAWLFQHTSWSMDYMGVAPELPHLPTLSHTTDVRALADALTWFCRLDAVDAPWELGALIRYAAGATGNEYADYGPDEIAADGTWWLRGIYDNPERLAYERQRQRGACALAAAYEALTCRCAAEPALLAEIAGHITATAQAIAPTQEGAPRCAA